MNQNQCNQSIKCTVTQCVYNCTDKQYCSLDRIMVGTHEMNPTVCECTDCQSFQPKGNGSY